MGKKDDLDIFIESTYGQVRDRIVNTRSELECPDEGLLKQYADKTLDKEKEEYIDRHLISCAKCLEALEVIRIIQEAKDLKIRVPEKLHNKTYALLKKELEKSSKCIKEGVNFVKQITLLWDQINETISFVSSNFSEIVFPRNPEFMPVRDTFVLKEDITKAPFEMNVKTKEGEILLRINHAEKKGYLALKIRFSFMEEKELTNVRVTLYKSGIKRSSVHLDENGYALFPRIKADKFCLEFVYKEEVLETLDVSIKAE